MMEARVSPQGFSLWQAVCWKHLFAATCVGNSADDSPATDSEWSHGEGRRARGFRFQQEKPSLYAIKNYPPLFNITDKSSGYTNCFWCLSGGESPEIRLLCCVVWCGVLCLGRCHWRHTVLALLVRRINHPRLGLISRVFGSGMLLGIARWLPVGLTRLELIPRGPLPLVCFLL